MIHGSLQGSQVSWSIISQLSLHSFSAQVNTLEQLWPVWKGTRSRHRDAHPGFSQRRTTLEAVRDLSTHPQFFKSFSCLQALNQWGFPPLLLLFSHHCSLQDTFNQVGILLVHSQGHLSDTTIFFNSRTRFPINIERTRPNWEHKRKKAQKMCSGPWCSRARNFRLHRIPELLLQ